MSAHKIASWLVTYDVSHPRRLARVFKYLKREGIPVQYSVFSVDASNSRMEALMFQISMLIDPKEDDVRAYRLPENGWRSTLGDAMLPDSLWIA